MKRVYCFAIATCFILILCGSTSFAQSAPYVSSGGCKKPIILEVLPSGSGVVYKLGGKSSILYPLTEMGNELTSCKVERAVDVFLDYHVSLAGFLGAVPSKLQAPSVRYFIRTGKSLVEISVVSYDANVPDTQQAR